eukprot:5418729-Pyramimonas_sp.AAC.1
MERPDHSHAPPEQAAFKQDGSEDVILACVSDSRMLIPKFGPNTKPLWMGWANFPRARPSPAQTTA